MGVADHEGDRHGLPQGPAQAEKQGPDNPHQAVRNGNLAGDFPGGGPYAVGRFLDHVGHQLEHVPGNGADKGQDHEGQDDPCGQHAQPHGRPLKERQEAQAALEQRLHVRGHERPKHEHAPHAVNDAGNGGQQFDHAAHHFADLGAGQFHQEQGDG